MIAIVPYRLEWREEFVTLDAAARGVLGALALRIDHIGSTAVPGLAAKDIIDIQVTVVALEPSVEQALNLAGYRRLERIDHDHKPPGAIENDEPWAKWFFMSPANSRRVNLHARVAGRANQRYPLLFRDYLRANAAVAEAYAQMKTAIARYHPDDIEAYCDIKDPVCDIIMGGAEAWAKGIGWEPRPSDS